LEPITAPAQARHKQQDERFASYFTSHKEKDYKTHILELLTKGVHIKAYLLDPESQEASIYFTDRGKV
jgi:hypothetical protein